AWGAKSNSYPDREGGRARSRSEAAPREHRGGYNLVPRQCSCLSWLKRSLTGLTGLGIFERTHDRRLVISALRARRCAHCCLLDAGGGPTAQVIRGFQALFPCVHVHGGESPEVGAF